jgi:hypothetical protein
MLQIFGWAVCIYLVIKVSHAIARPVVAYADPAATFGNRLRAGEPMLLIAALSMSIFATMYLDWFFHRLGEREYVHARGCYARLAAVNLLPREQSRLEPYAVEHQAANYSLVGEQHGPWWGLSQATIRNDFERARRSYLAVHAGNNSPQATAALLEEVRRCFNDEWEPHGDFLNP